MVVLPLLCTQRVVSFPLSLALFCKLPNCVFTNIRVVSDVAITRYKITDPFISGVKMSSSSVRSSLQSTSCA